MKTIIIVENEGQAVEYPEAHIFNGDMKNACQQAYDKRLFTWAESSEDIEEAILAGEGLACYTIDRVVIQKHREFWEL
jgi:hypothetical protein